MEIKCSLCWINSFMWTWAIGQKPFNDAKKWRFQDVVKLKTCYISRNNLRKEKKIGQKTSNKINVRIDEKKFKFLLTSAKFCRKCIFASKMLTSAFFEKIFFRKINIYILYLCLKFYHCRICRSLFIQDTLFNDVLETSFFDVVKWFLPYS